MDPFSTTDVKRRRKKEFFGSVLIPDVDAVVIVSKEGLPIASALPQAIDESKIAAISASLISLGEKSITEMEKGKLENMYIKGSEGYILMRPAGPKAILTVSTTKDARLGLIFLDCKRTCEKIAKLI